MKMYLAIIFLVILVVLGSGCTDSQNIKNNNPNIKVIAHNIRIDKYNDSVGSYDYNVTVTLEIQNIGTEKLSYVPLQVNAFGEDKNDNNQSYFNQTEVFFDLNPGEKRNLTLTDETFTEPAHVDYEVVIGNQTSLVNNHLLLLTADNLLNKTSEDSIPEKSVIPLKGKVLSSRFVETSDEYPPETPVTIIVGGDLKEKEVGQFQVIETEYGSYIPTSSRTYTVPGYQYYQAFIVIYWPSMEIAGKHVLYGSMPSENSDSDHIGQSGVYGESPDPTEWINSLPRG